MIVPFSIEQEYSYMLTLVFPREDFADGVYELFAFLVGQLTLYAEKNEGASRMRRLSWESLLTDLVEGKCEPAAFAERNRYSGLPERGAFRLVSLRRKDGRMRDFSRERLELAVPGDVAFVHGDSAFVLSADGRNPEPDFGKAPFAFIAENNIFVSGSNRFETLTDLHQAWRQTEAAYALGLRISRNRSLERLGIDAKAYDDNVFLYSDYYPYDLISDTASLFPAFRALLAEDEKTATGSLRLIYVYLKNDCSKTKTAAELFMHRNNIIYRIARLEEALGLSFQDERAKTAFRLSFLVLELTDPRKPASQPSPLRR
jgi:hypothetical protein